MVPENLLGTIFLHSCYEIVTLAFNIHTYYSFSTRFEGAGSIYVWVAVSGFSRLLSRTG